MFEEDKLTKVTKVLNYAVTTSMSSRGLKRDDYNTTNTRSVSSFLKRLRLAGKFKKGQWLHLIVESTHSTTYVVHIDSTDEFNIRKV